MAIVPLSKEGRCFKQMVSGGLAAFETQKHQQRLEREYINAIKERKSDAAVCTDSSDVAERAAPHTGSVDGPQNADRKEKKNIRRS